MITTDNLPKILFDATLLLLFWLMYRVFLLLIEKPKSKPDKLAQIIKILTR